MKTCTNCGIKKSLDEFYLHSGSPDGRTYRCKDCDKEYHRKRRDQERQRLSEEYGELTVTVTGCEHCMFMNDCNYLIWERNDDPYCFVSNPYHAMFIRYARNRADTRIRA